MFWFCSTGDAGLTTGDPLADAGLESFPDAGLDNLPDWGLEILPDDGRDSLPEEGRDSFAEAGLDRLSPATIWDLHSKISKTTAHSLIFK